MFAFSGFSALLSGSPAFAQDPDEIARWLDSLRAGRDGLDVAREAFDGAWVSATLDREARAQFPDGTATELQRGTKLYAGLHADGLTVTAQPGLLLRLPRRPAVRLTRFRYDFRTAQFDIDAQSAGFDVFGLYGGLARWQIRRILDRELKPRLPERLRTPGYSPATDPDLPGTVSELRTIFAAFTEDRSGAFDGAAMESLRDVGLGISMRSPLDYVIPLDGGRWEIAIPKGLRVTLSAATRGPLTEPRLDWFRLAADPSGITVRATGGAFARTFKSMRLSSIDVRGGGRHSFAYDLGAEDMIDGVMGLLALLSIASGHDPGSVPRARLESARRDVDVTLAREVPPRLHSFAGGVFRAYLSPKLRDWLQGVLDDLRPHDGVDSRMERMMP